MQDIAIVSPAVFQSRWGFHPFSIQVSRQLRRLNVAYQRALRQAAAWNRWNRKEPQNRVVRPRIRNDKWQVIGYGRAEPVGEPKLCPVFCFMGDRVDYCRGGPDGFTAVKTQVAKNDGGLGHRIWKTARYARTPMPTPEQAIRNDHDLLTVAEIEDLIRRLA